MGPLSGIVLPVSHVVLIFSVFFLLYAVTPVRKLPRWTFGQSPLKAA